MLYVSGSPWPTSGTIIWHRLHVRSRAQPPNHKSPEPGEARTSSISSQRQGCVQTPSSQQGGVNHCSEPVLYSLCVRSPPILSHCVLAIADSTIPPLPPPSLRVHRLSHTRRRIGHSTHSVSQSVSLEPAALGQSPFIPVAFLPPKGCHPPENLLLLRTCTPSSSLSHDESGRNRVARLRCQPLSASGCTGRAPGWAALRWHLWRRRRTRRRRSRRASACRRRRAPAASCPPPPSASLVRSRPP